MPPKVGVPRALLYYHYYPMWKTFLDNIGAEVVLSGLTNKCKLKSGLQIAVDETCLPVKIAFGHVADLINHVDYLFIPRMVSVAPREYICPKFLGFPDMIRGSVSGLPDILDGSIDLYRNGKDLGRQLYQVGRKICPNHKVLETAVKKALLESCKYFHLLEGGLRPDEALAGKTEGNRPEGGNQVRKVAVIGHPYNIFDSYISHNLIVKLEKAGIRVIVPENLDEGLINKHAGKLDKRLFWTLGRRMVGSAVQFLADESVRGIIHVSSFACGLDSMTGEMIELRARKAGVKPFMNLTLDEHTGEAGIDTRIEAFLDMISLPDTA